MHDANAFLVALTIVLGTAGVTTVLFHRLRQPVVLGYILAGLIVSPSVPIPLLADREIIQTLSELGVILLMFSLGLEFSLGRLIKVGPTAGLAAVIQSSLMVWLGFLAGQALGWTALESLFAGAIIAISSTTIIAKAFDEQRVGGTLREVVVGILIVEDLIAILLMAVLTAIASSGEVEAAMLLRTSGRLGAFLVGLVVIGLLVVPRTIRAIARLGRPEMTIVVSIGLCFAIALLSHSLGYSVALGAFLAGSLVAESGEEKQVEEQVRPIRDLFGAIFFVSVGMIIDPALIAEHWAAVAILTAVVIAGKVVGVSFGAFLAGHGTRTSVRAGMSLAQIGEFSFIIAGLGITLGATGQHLYPIAVAVSALTTLATPWLIRGSDRAATFVDHVLPDRLQTFGSLYGSWLEQMRATPRRQTATFKRLLGMLVLDAAFVAAVIIGAAVAADAISAAVAARVHVSADLSRILVVVAAVALASPFAVGVARVARRLGEAVADTALPARPEGKLDLAAAPRRALVVALQLGMLLAVCLPLAVIAQVFLPGPATIALVPAVLLLVAVAMWRSTGDLQGHVRAGAAVVVQALASQAHRGAPPEGDHGDDVERLLAGLGKPVSVALDESSPAVGKTLVELDLRGRTGAAVLAISQAGEVTIPTAQHELRAGDILALAGTGEAIAAARELLRGAADDPA
jgi:monovalent cation:H+ antiporter-2, CPA2 family